MSCNANTPNVNKTFIIEPLSITGGSPTLSACTRLYTNEITQCSGDTVNFTNNVNINGDLNIGSGGTINSPTYSGGTYYGDGSNLTGIIFTGNTSASCITDLYVSNIYGCSPIIVHDDVEIRADFTPDFDISRRVGTPLKRFRELNAYSGNTTLWLATQKVTTPQLELGLDSSGNTRTITADNSVIQDDCLLGGTY